MKTLHLSFIPFKLRSGQKGGYSIDQQLDRIKAELLSTRIAPMASQYSHLFLPSEVVAVEAAIQEVYNQSRGRLRPEAPIDETDIGLLLGKIRNKLK